MRKRYRQFLSSALTTTDNGIVNARPLVFVVLRFGVKLCVRKVENVLKTLRLSAIYFKDQETKR